MMQEFSTRGNLVFTCSIPLSYGVLKEVDNLPYFTPWTELCNQLSTFRAVAIWCSSESTNDIVDLNESIDISLKLIINNYEARHSRSFRSWIANAIGHSMRKMY